MPDRLSLAAAATAIPLLAADLLLQGGDATLFLARKLSDLVEYLAFWR